MGNKLLVICGATATGKTDLGVKLAKKFNGEIISADSRQVYKGMDILTGKDIPENSKLQIQNSNLNINNSKFEVGYRLKDDIPIWLVDIVEPDYPFSAGEYTILAQKILNDIWNRKKLPIIVGGTGFYIRSIINPFETYYIPPNKLLRNELENLNVTSLQNSLQEIDPEKWETMNDSDRKNPRRLIRAIEVARWKKKYSQKTSISQITKPLDIFRVGLRADFKYFLRARIQKRIKNRIANGVIEEVKKLTRQKYSWFLPAFSAAGFAELKNFLENKQTLDDAVRSWELQETEYAKSQVIWFKKEKEICWFDISERNYLSQIQTEVGKWYTRN